MNTGQYGPTPPIFEPTLFGGATRCFGRLEECCINAEVVGDCAGEWGC